MSKMIGFSYASNACLILNLNMKALISTAARGKNLSNLCGSKIKFKRKDTSQMHRYRGSKI